MFELKPIGIVKRASAWLLDAILLAVLATGLMWIVSLISNYSAEERLASEYYAQWENFRKEYIGDVAAFYGFTYEEDGERYTINKDGAPAALDDVVKALSDSNGEQEETAQAYEVYLTLPPVSAVNAQYRYVYTLLFMMVSFGLFFAFLILEFLLPIFFRNGQTVGKKVFAICIVRPDCVKITTPSLFVRTILGKFSIETMFPVLLAFQFFFGGMGLLSLILFAAILLLNVVLFFVTKNRTPIHDILAGTVAVDMKLQMIYASDEELNEKKALAQKEAVAQTKEQ